MRARECCIARRFPFRGSVSCKNRCFCTHFSYLHVQSVLLNRLVFFFLSSVHLDSERDYHCECCVLKYEIFNACLQTRPKRKKERHTVHWTNCLFVWLNKQWSKKNWDIKWMKKAYNTCNIRIAGKLIYRTNENDIRKKRTNQLEMNVIVLNVAKVNWN